jgi:hypothetical protein
VGDTITAMAHVTAVRLDQRDITLRAECANTAGVRGIAGGATAKLG